MDWATGLLLAAGAVGVWAKVKGNSALADAGAGGFKLHKLANIITGESVGDAANTLIVPRALVPALPYIDPRVWSVYAVGPLFDAVRAAAHSAPVLKVWPWRPQHYEQNMHAGEPWPGQVPSQKAFYGYLLDKDGFAKGSVAWSMMEAMWKKGNLDGGLARQRNLWWRMGEYGARLDAIDSGPAGLYCWPPSSWQTPQHRAAWWGISGAWQYRRPVDAANLFIHLQPDYCELTKLLPEFRTNPVWKFCCLSHPGGSGYARQGADAANCAYQYLSICVHAAACGLIPATSTIAKSPDSSYEYVQGQLQSVPPPGKNPYADAAKVVGLFALGTAKSPILGGLLGAAGIYNLLSGGRRKGVAENLWNTSFEPMLVPRSLFGAAGPANWLVKESDFPELPPWHEQPVLKNQLQVKQLAGFIKF